MSGSDLSPSLLVAMPQLADPNFRRAVVLILEHDENGTFGLVVNRATDLLVETLCESLEMDWHGLEPVHVDWGGPVQPDHGWLLLGDDEIDGLELRNVIDGVRFTSSPEILRQVAEDPPERLRVFLGYAGWGPGQLFQEIRQGAWLLAPVSEEFVFHDRRENLWEEVVRSLGVDPATLVPTQGIN